MRAAVLHAFGQVPQWEEFPQPVPHDGEELIEVTAAPLNNIDRVRADGSHYSVRSGEYASCGLPAVPGVIGAGRLPGGQRVLFGSRCGTMAQYSAASDQATFPIPDGRRAPGSGRVRLLQAGEMAGSSISLPGSVLRSAGLEVLGLGTGTMPPPEVITRMLAELLDLLSSGKLQIDIERVPLSAAGQVWTRDQQGRRPVFIP